MRAVLFVDHFLEKLRGNSACWAIRLHRGVESHHGKSAVLLPRAGRDATTDGGPRLESFPTDGGSFPRGVPVGPGHVVSRTPSVCPEKSKFWRYDDSDLGAEMDNYKSTSSEVLGRNLWRKPRWDGWDGCRLRPPGVSTVKPQNRLSRSDLEE